MIGSSERLRRHMGLAKIAPMMLLVIGVPAKPDPINKRLVGTSGVIPIPAVSVTPSAAARADLAAPEARRDPRADRGRVLYANGRAQRDSVAASTRMLHKTPCAEQRVVQARNGQPSPNS
jgi:hypothetical protein